MRTDWQLQADALRAHMEGKQPEVKIKDVQNALGYSSKSTAEYALLRMEEAGLVYRVTPKGSRKSTWFLAW